MVPCPGMECFTCFSIGTVADVNISRARNLQRLQEMLHEGGRQFNHLPVPEGRHKGTQSRNKYPTLYHYHYPGKVLNSSQQLVTQEIRAETARMSPTLTCEGRESLAKGYI